MINMRRFFYLAILTVTFGLTSCEKFESGLNYDPRENIFFCSQWEAILEDEMMVKDGDIIFDFDIFDNKTLTIYCERNTQYDDNTSITNEFFTSQAYKAKRVSKTTWVIDNYYFQGGYCSIVLQVTDLYSGGNWAEVTFFRGNDKVKTYTLMRSDYIVDLKAYVM